MLHNLGVGKELSENRRPVAQEVMSTIDKWDLKKLKSVCATKEIIV